MKKAWPQTRITVFERNRPDDTFGFGVVFSDQTLDTFENYDLESYRSITENFAYWDDIEIHFKGTVHRIGGNGFCGCSRATLLQILPPRAGARRRDQIPARGRSDRGRIARRRSRHRPPTASIRACARPSRTISSRHRPAPEQVRLDGLDTPVRCLHLLLQARPKHGIFIAHCYQYEPGRSTWIFETDPETFAAHGPRPAGRGGIGELTGRLFAEELQGHKLIINRSMWRNFPAIRCDRWVARKRRPARRRQGDRAFLDRLGHQARDGRRDRAL